MRLSSALPALVPILFSPDRIASGHVDFSLEDICEEQESIDKLMDSLLSFNPVSASASTSASLRRASDIENTASPVQIRGRGPGRPRGFKTATARPPPSPSPLLTEGSSLTTVIQCLNKLNVQNKRLLEYVESVSENVKKCVPIVSSESDGVSVAVTQQ